MASYVEIGKVLYNLYIINSKIYSLGANTV